MVAKYVSNTIRMKNWIACSSFSILFLLSLSAIWICLPSTSYSQSLSASLDHSAEINNYYNTGFSQRLRLQSGQDTTDKDPNPNLPDPKSVMYKSMIIPGWGQVVNGQIWKVPIVYGLIGGVAWYSIYVNKQYHDYRAAYYNLNDQLPNDFRYGPTPSYIPENANLEELKSLRNQFRNRRDLLYVGIAIAYGLNIVDAYVYAHMRSFDVSKDLSVRTRISPGLGEYSAYTAPGVTLSFDLIKK